jgi:quinolinate synthetase A subunit
MAETAKILSPSKKVLIADLKAGCSLAESITAEDVIQLRKLYPGAPVITYVNCSAEVKAETDICCTSANAVKIVNSVESDIVIFLPDEYLASNVQKHTQKTFKQVLNEYRITQACKALSFSDKSIELIAYQSGYGNQSFFNRVFKEIMHTTPMNYRRERQRLTNY